MTADHYKLLSEVYSLLGRYGPLDFKRAASIARGSHAVQEALICLEREATMSNRGNKRAADRPEPRRAGATERADVYSALCSILSNSGKFPNKSDLVELIHSLELPVKHDSRISRERLAKRIAKTVAGSRSLEQRLRRSLGSIVDTQTQGWLDLLLNGR